MNRPPVFLSLFLIAIAVAVGVFWTSIYRGDSRDSASFDDPADTAPARILTPVQGSPSGANASAPGIERREYDPEVRLALSGATRPGECEWVTRYITNQETGRQTTAQEMVCENEKPRHPYDEYTSDTLEGMAYNDPFAAIVLGKRLLDRDPEEAWRLMLRGAALLEDGSPLDWLAAMSYSRTAINGVADVSSIESYYVLASTANRISGIESHAVNGHRAANVHPLTDADIDRLDKIVENQLQRVHSIQSEFAVVSP